MAAKGDRGKPRDRSQPGDFVPSLMDVLSEAVEDAGKDWADLAPLMRKESGESLGKETIKRYLAGTHFPTGSGLDQWSRAVTSVTEAKDPVKTRFGFFRMALEQAEAEERSSRASGAARKARKKPPRQFPRRPGPKAT